MHHILNAKSAKPHDLLLALEKLNHDEHVRLCLKTLRGLRMIGCPPQQRCFASP
jgi:hypothetical protein